MRSVSPLAIASVLGLLSAACAPEGSSGAYVSRNVFLGSDCKPSDSGNVGIATGMYDVGNDRLPTDGCVHSYLMSLVVNSSLKPNARDSVGRAEPNVLQITHVDVTLMDDSHGTLSFKLADKVTPDAERPNPYRVLTASTLSPSTSGTAESGIVQIEAIPRIYAEKLGFLDGKNLIVQLQVFGTTTGGVDVDFRPFEYPIAICSGCMSFCKSDFVGSESDLTTLTSGKCADNGAQDDRICVHPGC
jgi:hypothetical protein